MHLHLKHLMAIILCNLYLMVQKLITAYIFVFSYRYSVAYHSNVSFLSEINYVIANSCFFLFCPLLSTIMFF